MGIVWRKSQVGGRGEFGFVICAAERYNCMSSEYSEAIMSQTATELLDAAMALPDEHRLELAEALLASIDPSLRPPLDESWREVIRQRSSDLKSGQATGISWAEVRRRAQERERD